MLLNRLNVIDGHKQPLEKVAAAAPERPLDPAERVVNQRERVVNQRPPVPLVAAVVGQRPCAPVPAGGGGEATTAHPRVRGAVLLNARAC